jgi:hypothetical protein
MKKRKRTGKTHSERPRPEKRPGPYEKAMALRGKVHLSIDLAESRERDRN